MALVLLHLCNVYSGQHLGFEWQQTTDKQLHVLQEWDVECC